MSSSENTDRVAIVTGGASGIGLATARHLAAEGHPVAVFDVQAQAAEKAAEELRADGAQALACEVDVTDHAAIAKALGTVREQLGPVSIIVTSAGIEAFDPVGEITPEKWNRIIGVNLTGTFNSIQPVIPDMVAAGWGRIITISSVSAQGGAPNMAHYVASKGGVMALTKALSYDLAPQGITVNTIPPSIVDTPMARHAEETGDFPGIDDLAPMTPVRRIGTADDIAAACAFLCSDKASFITGQVIGVNGGWYM
ncbi:SDR family oxidoreductase [Actinomadura barringtoniae]|uniref:SDR family oxidoreductase n=1 Tax=Actinomadura barringtoniae TaxID=1427535 RepID=A0A939PDI1_9ACTN|nr:SDR family NAD(P)-dependent oxidoreductase [Actinomadura barringtoniae]MBO2447689.1 SDR family oxidoreductase [Actinomadura barringtoniae]